MIPRPHPTNPSHGEGQNFQFLPLKMNYSKARYTMQKFNRDTSLDRFIFNKKYIFFRKRSKLVPLKKGVPILDVPFPRQRLDMELKVQVFFPWAVGFTGFGVIF